VLATLTSVASLTPKTQVHITVFILAELNALRR